MHTIVASRQPRPHVLIVQKLIVAALVIKGGAVLHSRALSPDGSVLMCPSPLLLIMFAIALQVKK